ncbi:alpha-glucuronidase family glycosyl hydrolase [Spirosoma radiotolerans]|uniref:Xylan alpha-1,2-glucuronidase n=1 Tax=Spirosoma radiotolerans TaxID=1379870 RepID=A0A0E3ZZL2_9BACT|nr:alpha-glucuronidase family glycosyl hydrolase [Spirosoma radiotolerans]AKD58275.1 alpha-glucuronidase [Spirosoma radiotolerans]
MKRILLFLLLISQLAVADDGYRLWLKYDLIKDMPKREAYARSAQFIAVTGTSPMLKSAADELQMGLQGLLGKSVPIIANATSRTGGIVLSVANGPAAGSQILMADGYRLTSRRAGNLTISGKTNAGVLYGVFALLRQVQTGQSIDNLAVTSNPKIQYRLLNHWDNTNGTIERGYAGESLWKWYELPETVDPRYRDYARANASLGINGTVVNNVNASARFLTDEYIQKVAALANVFRAYGIRIYLSVYFPAPKTLGSLTPNGLKTADPLDPAVRKWWAEKTKDIYKAIPDFGGFLVKANSEGEPGPQDYGRTHADGANMLAEALKPYDGIVLWRAFVYKSDPKSDRFKAAYEEFTPLDGTFDKKVIIQVKNGPIDFQPREPYSPLFGNMPKTPLAMEFQITQEYLGFATHWVYEAPLFKECLDTDTHVKDKGTGSTVANVIDGSLHQYAMTAIAGVANTGSDRNWTGNPMAQANWYAYGRLAWDHTLTSEGIAREWVNMTLTSEPKAVKTITDLMLRSRNIYVSYNTPLGLSRPWAGVHFAPEPWQEKSPRPDWTAIYYHRADSIGLGFDRTATGSNALAQYRPEVQKIWQNPDTCPLPYLLWFHHVPWTKKLATGRTLWDELCTHFYTGADSVGWMQQQWAQVKPAIDPQIFADVTGRLATQHNEAIWWRDSWVLYLQTYSKQPIPAPFQKPDRTLEDVKRLSEIYKLR